MKEREEKIYNIIELLIIRIALIFAIIISLTAFYLILSNHRLIGFIPKALELFLLNVILIISLFTAVSLIALNEREIAICNKRKESNNDWIC